MCTTKCKYRGPSPCSRQMMAAAFVAMAISTASKPCACDDRSGVDGMPVPANEVKDAWSKRSEVLLAFRIDWVANWHYSRLFALTSSGPDGIATLDTMSSDEVEELSHKDALECEQRLSLLISGSKSRYDRSGQIPTGVDEVREFKSVCAVDGQFSRGLSYATGGRQYPTGRVFKGAANEAVMDVGTMPIRASFCPLDKMTSGIPALESLSVEVSDDENKLIFVEKAANGRQLRYEFDRSMQYQLTRHTMTESDGTLMLHMDVSYVLHSTEDVWLPSSWNLVSFSANETPLYRLEARVTQVEINPVLSGDAFSLEFPPGTVVSDSRPGVHGYDDRFKDACYIVKSDGSARIVDRSERGLPYEELLNPPSPQMVVHPLHSRLTLWILIIVNIIAGIFVAKRVLRSR